MCYLECCYVTHCQCCYYTDGLLLGCLRQHRQSRTTGARATHQGAHIILLQELFETPYFCKKPNPDYLQLATTVADNPTITHFKNIAKELKVVLPISFFERAGQARFNSIAIIDADGSVLGVYRKSHIPDGPGYHEKYYFNPGDTGFKVWQTRYAKIGVGICWDNGFLNAHAPWHCRVLNYCSIPLQLVASRMIQQSPHRLTGSAFSKVTRGLT